MYCSGTSILAKTAETLYEFVPVENYLRVTEAVLRVFDAADSLRQNKMMARIKVLIHRHGIEYLRNLVEEELKQPWALEGDYDPEPLMATAQESPPDISTDGGFSNEEPDFVLWRATNVSKQIQEGYNAQEIYQFLTNRYGDFILLNPPINRTTYVLWSLPFILFTIGIMILYWHNRKSSIK